MASYAAGHIPTVDSRALVTELAAHLDDDVFRLYPGIAYRHILVVTGHPELLDARYTPPHDISDKQFAEYLPSGPGPIFCSITWSAHARSSPQAL
jgi:2,3-bisphosphoglycerate-independent phosphoglycerate mutase